MSKKCTDCFGHGEKCLAGCSAHPDNWYTCETCKGSGKQPMADPTSPNLALLCKLGSIARHAQELTSPDGHLFDKVAIADLLDDEAVVQWMADMDAQALLPVMRK